MEINSTREVRMNLRNAWFAEPPEAILKELLYRMGQKRYFEARCLQELLVESLNERYPRENI